MNITRLDHRVRSVADLEATVAFYERGLGMTAPASGALIPDRFPAD